MQIWEQVIGILKTQPSELEEIYPRPGDELTFLVDLNIHLSQS